eukprot:s3512_g5.t1
MILWMLHSQFDPVLVLCRAEKVCGAMAQLMHTVLSVQTQRFEHGPVARLPSKTLCGQDCTVDHLDVIMAGTWMLCGNGYGLIWTLSWLAHGCSAAMDMV